MKNKQKNELAVCGFATVKKLEKNHPEKITRLYFTEEVAPKFGGLCKKLAKQHGIYNQKPAADLELKIGKEAVFTLQAGKSYTIRIPGRNGKMPPHTWVAFIVRKMANPRLATVENVLSSNPALLPVSSGPSTASARPVRGCRAKSPACLCDSG